MKEGIILTEGYKMGKIKRVSLRRVFNLGNYENVAIELIAVVDEGEDVQKVLRFLDEEAKEYRESLKI